MSTACPRTHARMLRAICSIACLIAPAMAGTAHAEMVPLLGQEPIVLGAAAPTERPWMVGAGLHMTTQEARPFAGLVLTAERSLWAQRLRLGTELGLGLGAPGQAEVGPRSTHARLQLHAGAPVGGLWLGIGVGGGPRTLQGPLFNNVEVYASAETDETDAEHHGEDQAWQGWSDAALLEDRVWRGAALGFEARAIWALSDALGLSAQVGAERYMAWRPSTSQIPAHLAPAARLSLGHSL